MDNKQVGGTHYDKLKISPFEYAEENNLLKYSSKWVTQI